KVEWHKVSDLPTWIRSRDKDTPYHCGGGCVKYGSSRFYMVVPFVSKLRHWLKSQRKLVRKRITDTSQQEESSEVMVFNGHGTDSGQKETSPETSVPGTESEGSLHEQSPTFDEKIHKSSPNIQGTSQTIIRSMFSLDDSMSTQMSTFPTLQISQELQQISTSDAGLNFEYNQMSASEFTQPHSYFSTSLPLGQSPFNSYTLNGLTFHQSTPSKIQSSCLSTLEDANLHAPRRKSSIGTTYSNSHSHINTTNNHDITAPVPINANSNAAIAALDPEQKLRRNSLLNLFTASTKQCETTTPIPSITVGHDDKRRNSLLNVLQSEIPSNQIYPNSTSITRDDVSHNRTQQSLFHFLPNSYDHINTTDTRSSSNVHNNTMFSMFQHSATQRNPKVMTTHPGAIPDSNYLGNRRDSAFSRHSSQGITTPKLSNNIGPIGQGRPSNNNENHNPEVHEVARKMSLLGLFSTTYSSNSDKSSPNTCHTTAESPIKQQNTFFSSSTMNSQLGIPGTPSSLRVNNESLLRLITASPPPQGVPLSPKVFDAEIQAQERALLNLLKLSNPSNNNGIVNENVSPNLMSNDSMTASISQGHNQKISEFGHAFIPPGGTNPKEEFSSRSQHLGYNNPMVSFKFDVAKIVAAL
ncbi:7817_t:CDS:2, partial [Scutellospora calospora]